MNAIRRLLFRDFPQFHVQQLNLMVPAKMKQIEEEVKSANNEVKVLFSQLYIIDVLFFRRTQRF